jgi:hypothetical protein
VSTKPLLIATVVGITGFGVLTVNSNALLTDSPHSTVAPLACGGEHRWGVKTLSDQAADRVRYNKPKRHTVEYMLNRTDPHVGATTARDLDGSHVEITVYQLVGVRLVNARIEEDGDIHLVIRDKHPEHMMIVEFPNTLCKGADSSAHTDEMTLARDDFTTLCGLPSWATRIKKAGPKRLTGWAAVIGVGFFDLKHGTPQVGVAPNNI